uniref:Uncharacterized protein n=1 Tax=Pipistrellus kuhlii TaxID=59472 RepID=A0A7J8B1F5_PIPKU|nr:hypothetical protein mPipKuh1_007703 [Pipistrellus kuhlii]
MHTVNYNPQPTVALLQVKSFKVYFFHCSSVCLPIMKKNNSPEPFPRGPFSEGMPRGQLPREDVQVLILKFEMGEVGIEIPFHSLKKAIECLSEGKKMDTLHKHTKYSLGFQFLNPRSPSHGLVRVYGPRWRMLNPEE